MDSTKLNDWMQVVGIFALVASLIFVGLQMKQSQEIAIAAQYQERYASMLEVLSDRQLDPDHARYIGEREIAMHGLPPGFDISVGAREYGRQFMDVRIALLTLDNYHFQYESGFLTEDAWAAYVRLYSISMGGKIIVTRFYVGNYKDTYRQKFQTVIEQMVGGIGE